MSKTLGSVLDEHRGFGPGFDFVRVFLAVSVVLWHSQLISRGSYGAALATPLWIWNYSILPMFFGLSGFLVAASAQRLSLSNFMLNRALRIFPALVVEISLSALVLGPLFSTHPPAEYFSDSSFLSYFFNILGWIHYTLPGVFEDNPQAGVVNGALWTVPFEMLCYLVMGILIVFKFVRNGSLLLASAAAATAASIAFQTAVESLPDPGWTAVVLREFVHEGKGPLLLPCFLLGAAAYALRKRIPFDIRIFGLCVVGVILMGVFARPDLWRHTIVIIIAAPLMIYLVTFVGLCRIPKLPFFSRGDYSYGIYLYGYPIQQALIATFPATLGWFLPHFLVSLVLVTLFATLSWHFIEKPILSARKRFSFVARRHEPEFQISPMIATDASRNDSAKRGG